MPKKNAIVRAEVDIEIPFFDIDPMEIVWHGHYLKYFEIARCKLLDKIDYNYPRMKESGYAWPIIELFVRYPRPIRFGQLVKISAELVDWESRMTIRYLATDATSGQRLTRGHTIQVAVSVVTGEMSFVCPEVLRNKLEHYASRKA